MAEKSKVLILGPTGSIGKYIVAASVKAGHPTFALVRKSTASNPDKAKLLENFKSSGVTLLDGDLTDHASLVNAIKQADVLISAAGRLLVDDQVKLIAAIKEAGNIKRFFPSEFGLDVDRHDAVDPVKKVHDEKVKIRRLIEAEGIPYTYLCCHAFASYFLRTLTQLDVKVPPRDKVVILGDGNVKGAYVTEEDVGTYTIKAVDDPRTLNKTVHIRLPANYLTFNEVVSIWEKKIGKTLEKIYVPEDKILKDIEAFSFPQDYVLALNHSMQVRGDAVYEIDPSIDVEAYDLYPEVKYTTADEYLNQFV